MKIRTVIVNPKALPKNPGTAVLEIVKMEPTRDDDGSPVLIKHVRVVSKRHSIRKSR